MSVHHDKCNLYYLSSLEAPNSPCKLLSYIFKRGDDGEFGEDEFIEDDDKG